MPNWCSCDLFIHGSQESVERFLAGVRGKSDTANAEKTAWIDFNAIIPMPPALLAVMSGSDEMYYEAKYGGDAEVRRILSYPWAREDGATTRTALWECLVHRARSDGRDADAIADAYHANINQHGHRTWYTWAVEKWGTKWNACDTRLDKYDPVKRRAVLHFDTAWSPPLPVVVEASRQYPDVRLTLRYYECGCAFKGHLRVYGGKVLSEGTASYRGRRGG